jgi:VWFA-related protein
VGLAAGLAGLAEGSAAQAQGTGSSTPASKHDSAQTQTMYTIQTRVPLTILDVVVTDSKGKPVQGLKESDFTVLEDGQRMTPKTFEKHRSYQTPPKPEPPKLNLGPNTFTNFTYTPPKAGPLNILLEDDLNTPFTGQSIIRSQIVDFLKKSPNGARIAIFRLSSGLSILQGFTNDPELLKAAILSKKNLPQESHLFYTGMGAEANLEVGGGSPGGATSRFDASVSRVAGGGGGTASGASGGGDDGLSSRQESRLFTITTSARVQGTLAAMNEIARYLAGMPGRKNLIWFSASFPVSIPLSGLPDLSINEDYSDEVKSMGDALARSQVAVYSIDGRGLDGNAYAVGESRYWLERKDSPRAKARTINEHGTLQQLSDETGGKAFYNTNDLGGAVQEALDDGSNYYTITYTPTNDKQDGKYRKIHVDMDQPHLHLAYRPGYYMDAPGGGPKPEQKVAGRAPAMQRPNIMQTAMLPGAVEPTEILFKVKVVPAAGTETALPAGNQSLSKLMKPPYRHYTVGYAADATNIAATTTSDGMYHVSFEFVTKVYTSAGEAINLIGNTVHTDLTSAQYQAMLKDGIIHDRQEIDVPTKGDYILRIGIHDFTSDHVGAVEIPLSTLQPEAAPDNTNK